MASKAKKKEKEDKRPPFQQRPSFTQQLSSSLSSSLSTSLSITQQHPTKKQCCRKECVVVPVLVLVLVWLLRSSVIPELALVERLPLPENLRLNITVPVPRPGEILKNEGVKPKYPVLLLPGIVSTGLELWDGHGCASHLFRKRIWGTMTMAQELLTNMDCWVNHMQLDPATGLDPEGVKIRGAFGLKAADYLLPGFWIWAKVIENLADIGYDSNTMNLVGYDWRLASYNMQQRDLTMLKIKTEIEMLRKSMNNEKVVIATHSMGSNVLFYFLKWVESEKGGKGGERWVNDNVEGIVSVGGSWLGAPKVYASLMSGEMKDTAALGTGSVIIDNYVPKALRVKVMRTFHSMLSILPKGGDRVWGNATFAPDDIGWPYNDTYNNNNNNNNNNTYHNVDNNNNNSNKGDEDLTQFCLSEYGSFGEFLRIERDQEEGEGEKEEKEEKGVKGEKEEKEEKREGEGESNEEGGKGESCNVDVPTSPSYSPSPSPSPSPSLIPPLGRSSSPSYSSTALSFLSPNVPIESKILTMKEGIELLKDVAGDNFLNIFSSLYSDKILPREDKKHHHKEEGKQEKQEENGDKEWWKRESLEEEASWTSPLASPLPSAPNLTLYCLYGVRKLTERSYVYEHSRATFFDRWRGAYPEKHNHTKTENNNNENNNDNNDPDSTPNHNHNHNHNHHNHGEANGETVRFSMKTWSNCDDQCSRRNGVANSDGDGTVPLVSLGYMCVKGWVDPSLPFNPGKSKIVTKEFIDTPSTFREDGLGLRGGTKTGDHVDIMGNYQVIMDILLVASGRGKEVKQEIHSSIEEISERVKI